ncbi:uncharacterized protein LOC131850914 isoform X2 [Achroia grisella]|uniref:uncharacterized protein LOC131850914 isoform X2 n=1 Tax=Achroia grisella TaxID=688607 RepID=UPI0027D2C0D1|nr:uncharacterized protein LOC131850914 isoform X2 [Achroia grisella]
MNMEQSQHKIEINSDPEILNPSDCSCINCDTVRCFTKFTNQNRITDKSSREKYKKSKISLNLSNQRTDFIDSKSVLTENVSNLVKSGEKPKILLDDISSMIKDDKDLKVSIEKKEQFRKEINYEHNNINTHITEKKSKYIYKITKSKDKINKSNDVNEGPAQIRTVSVTYSRREISPNTAHLSADIMNLPLKDFKESISINPTASPSCKVIKKLSKYDIFKRIKEAYNACRCKVCDCIVGTSLLNSNQCKCIPCECKDCTDFMKKLNEKIKNVPPNGCACIRCDRSQCKGIVDEGFQSCDCMRCTNNLSKPCDCIPCDCLECRAVTENKANTIVVAPVGEDYQSNTCQCSPCQCAECGHGFPLSTNLMHEMSTDMSRHINCRCENCILQTCGADDNDDCICDRMNKVMKKPVQRDSHDYDIRCALINTIKPALGPISKRPETYNKIAMFTNNFPGLNTDLCSCDECQCIYCKNKHKTVTKKCTTINPVKRASSENYNSMNMYMTGECPECKEMLNCRGDVYNCVSCKCENCMALVSLKILNSDKAIQYDLYERFHSNDKKLNFIYGSNIMTTGNYKQRFTKTESYILKYDVYSQCEDNFRNPIFKKKNNMSYQVSNCISKEERNQLFKKAFIHPSFISCCNRSTYDNANYLIKLPKTTAENCLNDVKKYSLNRNYNFNGLNMIRSGMEYTNHMKLYKNNEFSNNNKKVYLNSLCKSTDQIKVQNNVPIKAKKLKKRNDIFYTFSDIFYSSISQDFNIVQIGKKNNNTDLFNEKKHNALYNEGAIISKPNEPKSNNTKVKNYIDYERVQNILSEATAYSLELMKILQKYETANREFQSISEKLKQHSNTTSYIYQHETYETEDKDINKNNEIINIDKKFFRIHNIIDNNKEDLNYNNSADDNIINELYLQEDILAHNTEIDNKDNIKLLRQFEDTKHIIMKSNSQTLSAILNCKDELVSSVSNKNSFIRHNNDIVTINETAAELYGTEDHSNSNLAKTMPTKTNLDDKDTKLKNTEEKKIEFAGYTKNKNIGSKSWSVLNKNVDLNRNSSYKQKDICVFTSIETQYEEVLKSVHSEIKEPRKNEAASSYENEALVKQKIGTKYYTPASTQTYHCVTISVEKEMNCPSTTESKSIHDALKVSFLGLRRVSDHTVRVKWNVPQNISDV